jgi:hypothetical protein
MEGEKKTCGKANCICSQYKPYESFLSYADRRIKAGVVLGDDPVFMGVVGVFRRFFEMHGSAGVVEVVNRMDAHQHVHR